MKISIVAVIIAIAASSASVNAEECLPAGSGGCDGDIVQVNSSLNVRFDSVGYVGILHFWNKTSCTLKPFKYQLEYEGTVQDNEGRNVPGIVKEPHEFQENLPPHVWIYNDQHGRMDFYGGAKNPRIVLLYPLECTETKPDQQGTAPAAAGQGECCFVLRNGKMVKMPSH